MADTVKTRRVLRLNRVNGDGRKAPERVACVLKHPDTGEELRDPKTGEPEVIVWVKPMPEARRKEILASHTTREKDPNGGKGLFEFVDAQAAADEILQETVLDWDGIAGADDTPLTCTNATKLLLDQWIRNQVTRKAFGAEVAEVLAESFR